MSDKKFRVWDNKNKCYIDDILMSQDGRLFSKEGNLIIYTDNLIVEWVMHNA